MARPYKGMILRQYEATFELIGFTDAIAEHKIMFEASNNDIAQRYAKYMYALLHVRKIRNLETGEVYTDKTGVWK